jgi:hypothetical protein
VGGRAPPGRGLRGPISGARRVAREVDVYDVKTGDGRSAMARDEAAALADITEAVGGVRPLLPEHRIYLGVLALALAVARRAALRPQVARILADRAALLTRELRACGVDEAVIRRLLPNPGVVA